MIHVRRFAENPLIVPERVQPWHPNCEIVGALSLIHISEPTRP